MLLCLFNNGLHGFHGDNLFLCYSVFLEQRKTRRICSSVTLSKKTVLKLLCLFLDYSVLSVLHEVVEERVEVFLHILHQLAAQDDRFSVGNKQFANHLPVVILEHEAVGPEDA